MSEPSTSTSESGVPAAGSPVPMRCFTMAHIAQWWGIQRSSVTMMRKRWGPDSAAPFPVPDVELIPASGDTVIPGWAWQRWPAEFEAWDHQRKQAPRRRSGTPGPGKRPTPRRDVAPKPAALQAPEQPAPSADGTDSPAPKEKIRTRDYIKPGRRTHSGARQGRVAAGRVARAVSRGRARR
ncbi:hypothetical protein [Amycolatopsis sp. cmx-4-54]|uniref:hypothetical protein n=1 Tax=Amycolatopsis sp. cmx-4-54 TaxID=2790936 RepID=UPI00397B1B4C